jgi:hypothetical protein
MKFWIILVFLLVSLFFLFSFSAQSSQDVSVAPDGTTNTQIEGIYIPQTPNAPFTAKQVVEWNRPLTDDTVIMRTYFTIVARDSLGRVRRENRNSVPANSSREPRLNYTFFLDPDARTRTDCYASTHICRVVAYRPVTSLTHDPAPQSINGAVPSLEREALGNSMMESLQVIGSRETLTVHAEAIGSNHDFAITKEIWFSPQLQVNLSVVRNDPRVGTQTFRLTEVTLGEPDSQLFLMPADYRVVDERKPE